MTKVFTDSTAPNKQVVMKEMYHTVSKNIHHVDAVILPSKYPFRPLRRLFRFGLVGKNNKIYGYETDKDIALCWCDSTGKSSIYETEKRMKDAGYPFSIKNGHANFRLGSVINCPITQFMNLDFCSNWTCKRDLSSMQDQKSSIFIFMCKLLEQKRYFPDKPKALLGTVSLWGTPNGKSVSRMFLTSLVKAASTENNGYIKSIDYDGEEYGIGTKISTEGFLHNNGGIYHAYEHLVKLGCAENVDLRMFTYNDGCPMLSFALLYK